MMKKLMRSSVAVLILLVCCDAASIGGEYLPYYNYDYNYM